MGVSVRPGTKSDVPLLSKVLADAFDDDPVMSWILPDPASRKARMARMFSGWTRHHHLAGGGVEVAVDTQGAIGGAALWDPPGRWKQSTWSSLMVIPTLLRAMGGRARVGAGVDAVIEAAHPSSPHWYLATIGTGTTARGGGYGKALLASRLDRCDADHVPAYLESSKAANIPYYQRFGFEVTGEIAVPGGGPTLYPMWREPR